MSIHTLVRNVRLAAKVEADAPAKVRRPVKWRHEPEVMQAKFLCSTREPDIFDEVTGHAIWFGDTFAVVVPAERLDGFRTWVACRGMTPGGLSHTVEHLTTANATLDEVLAAVKR